MKKNKKNTNSVKKTITPDKKRVIFAGVALIILLGFGVYANSLHGNFIWDDDRLIQNNKYIRNLSYLPEIFTQSIDAGSLKTGVIPNLCFSYRPVQICTYALDYSLWKLNPKGYHFGNILLHVLTALCVYWLISLLFSDKILAVLTSAFFVIHPIHTAAVSYISGRADPLAGLFILLSFILYLKAVNRNSRLLYLGMSACFIIALLSRENSIIFPFLLLFYHYCFRKRLELKHLTPLFFIGVLYILLRTTVLTSLMPHTSSTSTAFQRIPGFFAAVTNYTGLLLLPLNLHMEYGDKLFAFNHPKTLIGIIIFSSLLVYTLRKREANKLLFFSVYWFFLTLLLSSNIYPLKNYMAEHWLYLPSIGFFLITAKTMVYFYREKGCKTAVVLTVVCLITFYSCLTIKQNSYWREPVTFYNRMLKYAPESPKLYFNLANRYKDMGRYEESIEFYKKTIELQPHFVNSYVNLGNAYSALGKHENTIEALNRVINITPRYAGAYYNLGNTYKTLNKKEEAITAYKNALTIIPNYADVYNNLGSLYREMGKKEEAILSYKKVLEINPRFAYAYRNLGLVYFDMENYKKSAKFLEKAVKLKPDYLNAYNNLGAVYYNMGKYEESIESLKKAVKLNPEDSTVYLNIAIAYYRLNQFDKAVQYCDKAIALGAKVSSELLKHLYPQTF